MPIRELDIKYIFAHEMPKLKAILSQSAKGRQWVSTSIHEGHERWKFCRLVNEPDPGPKYYYSPPVYPGPLPKKKKKVSYPGDDTRGNRGAWHR